MMRDQSFAANHADSFLDHPDGKHNIDVPHQRHSRSTRTPNADVNASVIPNRLTLHGLSHQHDHTQPAHIENQSGQLPRSSPTYRLRTDRSNATTIATNGQSHPAWNVQHEHDEKHAKSSKPRGRFNRMRSSHRRAVKDANPQYRTKDIRGHFVAMSGEFIGTFLFLWSSLAGASYALNQDTSAVSPLLKTYFVAVIFGISLLANVWIFYRISGGLFNPVVTLALVMCGQLPAVRGLLLFPVQIVSGMCAAGLVEAMFPDPLSAVTRLQLGTSVAQGLFIEMFLTALLVITVLMLAAEKSKDTFLAPVGIGLAFFAAELVGVPYTGASLNPARSLGSDIATRSFPGYHWIYWLGPLLGALVASAYYRLAKYLNYEEANPGQDSSHSESEQV